ncbi:hypothetical protein D3C76_1344750 [compost metagenome]
MHDYLGLFLTDQLLGPLGGGLWHHHRYRQAQNAPGNGHGNPSITARRGDETALALPGIGFTGGPDAAQLERTGRLQRVELEPDVQATGQAQRA